MSPKAAGTRSPLYALTFYALMIGGAVLAFQGVSAFGSTLVAPGAANPAGLSAAAKAASKFEPLPHLLIALIVILGLARVLGALCRYLKQPAVIGEVLAGIALGPSLLGRVAPALSDAILPREISPLLSMLAQLGVILFMFTVGLELDMALVRKRTHATVAISHASIVVPFVLGGVLALVLYPRLATRDVPFHAFALFIGVSMSVTAFPVLARILTDRGLSTSRLGVIALTCAAVDDVTAWCLLGFVVAVVKSDGSGALLSIVAQLAVYLGFMFIAVRPLIERFADAQERLAEVRQDAIAVTLGLVLISALITEWIGIHALFGAFLVGALVPHDSQLSQAIQSKLRDVVLVLFLPAFFAFTGTRTRISLVSGGEAWLLCGLIIAVASLGKFGGTLSAARLTGMAWRDAAALGILMNTRGLVELIVLNMGYDLGVISPTLFAMLVIMALVTTAATTPILDRLTQAETPQVPAFSEQVTS